MSNRYGPRIVTDGLVCCLDAADRNSYPGTGTTWYDLSGNEKHGTFGASTAAPTFSSANGGVLNFDGSNDYARISNVGVTGTVPISFCFWGNVATDPISDGGMVIYGTQGTQFKVAGIYYRKTDSNVRFTMWGPTNNDDYPTGFLKDYNQWHFWSCVYNGTSVLIYRDAISDPSGSKSRSIEFTTSTLEIGAATNNGSYLNQKISLVQFYNRALSANEVQQNYNATKGRFGL